jgi:hypothetical protein
MAKATSDTNSTIEGLLQQRAQYEQWLARLESAGDKAPPAVRARVRGDYETRLRGVIDELRGHAATIAQELDRHKATQGGLDLERRQAEEALAEAEVRYTVGEYSEDEWRKLSEASNERLTGLRSELRLVGDEIARLAEVQGLIGGAPKRVEPPPQAPAPVAVAPPEPEPEPEPEPAPPPPAASRPAAKAAPPREPEITHGPPPVDELAFLKSVAAPEERRPAPPPSPAPAPSRRGSNPGTGGPSAGRPAETAGGGQTTATGKGGAAGVAKTLKCGECGTLNRPTEWYCERCGAELAGI